MYVRLAYLEVELLLTKLGFSGLMLMLSELFRSTIFIFCIGEEEAIIKLYNSVGTIIAVATPESENNLNFDC